MIPDWVIVKELDELSTQKALEWQKQIDAGESAAIALSLQLHSDWLLSDDVIARQFAEILGLEVHGSIGVLLWAIATGHVEGKDAALKALDALTGSSLWISDRVLEQARKAILKLFKD